MSSFKSNVLAAVQTPRHKVFDTPWGKVRIISLLGSDYDKLAEKRSRVKSRVKDHALLVVATCFEPETNKPCFTDDDIEDLCSGNAVVARHLAELAAEVNSVEEMDDESGNATTAG